MAMPTALEIARQATLKPITEIAEDIGIPPWLTEQHGEHVAKIDLKAIEELQDRPKAKYVVVTAITPTPLGEGKTTTTIGLGMAFRHIGKKATIAIRQASMGPTFGIKGGAAGGGYSQAVPFELLNLHLTGDMHAVTAAHNQIAAMVDNSLYMGNPFGLDLQPDHLEAGDRRQRPRAAQHRDRPWRGRRRRPAAGGLRHHRGERGDGGARAVHDPERPAGTAWPHRRRLHQARRAGHRRAAPGGRRRCRHDARGAQAEPAADPGEHPGLRARRPVRQHRARQLVASSPT